MEDNIIENANFSEKVKTFIKKRKKILLLNVSLIIIIFICVIFLQNQKIKLNKLNSEKNIQAGIYLSSKEFNKSKELYREIINSGNEFYSILALNNIIENNLELDEDMMLEIFNEIEKQNFSKEQKNLVKLKKALFLKKHSKEKDGNDLLKEIIDDGSIWKETATKLLK